MALFGLLGGKKTSVGLDIGSGIIKLAVIDHSGSEPELIKVATTEVAADAIVEGEVMDPGLVSEAIRGLFSTAGVKQRTVVTAVGGRDVIVKKIQMDRMKEGDAREVIRWEAEQPVPFDMANVELDFQILDPDAEGLQMNVLLVAAKRELVDSRTSLLGEAGLEAGIIDVDAFAIHNAFELNHPDAMQGVVGLVNIGHEVTNVNILEDGVPVLTRDLSVGTRRFREDLQREKGLSAEDSERAIQGQAQSGDLAQYVDARGPGGEARRMIEINLLPGKKKKAAGGGAGFKLALPDFRGLIASIKNPWLLAASAASLIVVGGGLLWFITQSTRLRVAQNRRIEVQAEKRRFDAVIAQKRQSERIRDSLVAEINVIRGIDADRYIWPHVLDQITKALPPYTWLTGISAAGGGNVAPGAPGSLPVGPGTTDSTGRPQVRIWITGSTVDIQAFTTFLRQLAASPWLTDVMPATTSTIIEADRPVTAFNVAVRFRVADSVYIRTVPLTQSAR